MEQTAPSMSILNVIFRAVRRRPLSIPPSSRPRRRRILWSLIKKNHDCDGNEDEVQHKI